MLTIKYRDHRGSESIIPGIGSTSWHEGALTGQIEGGGSVTFGPNFHSIRSPSHQVPVAFVVNENGATVAKYEFHMLSADETRKIMRRAEEALGLEPECDEAIAA